MLSDMYEGWVLFYFKMSSCVEELESLVSLASSIFEGKDPNVSLLLGVTGKICQIFTCLFYNKRIFGWKLRMLLD